MKLNEVYQNGAEIAQGSIKSTFVELYNQDGKKLYSLNKDQLGYNILVLTDTQPDENNFVEVSLTPIASQAVLRSADDVDPNQIFLVKEDVVDWATLDESNLPSGGDEKQDLDESNLPSGGDEKQEQKQSKTILFIGLGLLVLSLLKK